MQRLTQDRQEKVRHEACLKVQAKGLGPLQGSRGSPTYTLREVQGVSCIAVVLHLQCHDLPCLHEANLTEREVFLTSLSIAPLTP